MSSTSYQKHAFQTIHHAFQRYGAALCVAAAVGCSGTADSEGTGASGDGSTDGTTDVPDGNNPDPSSVAPELSAASDACFSARSSDGETAYGLWSYDSAARLLTRLAVDEDGTPMKTSSPVGDIHYWKLDAAGYVVMKAETLSLDAMSLTNTTRDEHGNPLAVRGYDNARFDVDAPYDTSRFGVTAGSLYYWYDYSNEYDDQGLLTRVMSIVDDPATPTSEQIADEARATLYEHDTQGRCSSITRYTNRVDRFEYDDQGKLARRAVTGAFRSNLDGRFDSTITYVRDDRGRLTSVTELYEGSDTPIPRLELTYQSDGRLIEERQLDPSLGGGDGFGHTVWSPGCADIVQLMTSEPGLECHTNRDRSVGDFSIP